MSTDTLPNAAGRAPGPLAEWTAKRLGEHVESPRTMRPVGVPVAYSRTKFHAVLLALTTESPADQAARLGISRAQLYNWQSEAAFKAKVAELADAFVGRVRNVVADAQANDAPRRGRYIWPDGSPILVDAPAYGPPVLAALHRLLDTETDKDVLVALAGIVLDAPLGRPLWCHAAMALAGITREYLIFTKGRSASRARAIHALEMQDEALANLWAGDVENTERAATHAAAPRADAASRAEPHIVVPLHVVEASS